MLSGALDELWCKYRKRLNTCRQDVSEDNVHELRISTRRLLALIELLRTLHPQATLGKLRKTLKHQLDGFDELRDTQVMLLEIANGMLALPDLAPFLSYLQQREQQLFQETGPHIASLRQGRLRRKIQKAGRRIKTHSSKTDLNTAVLNAIDKVYATALQRYLAITVDDLASIHHLRIPLKKLRYLLASVPAMVPDLPENHLRNLQDYLTRMGDIQNSAVLLRALELFFVDGVPEEIQQYYRKQQRALIDEFIEHRGEIFGLWRSTPDQALPWQAEHSGSAPWRNRP